MQVSFSMPFSFKTILVPIDFSVNTEVAINKALELADKETATIHLVHLLPRARFGFLSVDNKKMTYAGKDFLPATGMIQKKEKQILETTSNIKVHCWIFQSVSVQEGIEEKVRQLKPDVVIIGKKSNHSWLPFLNTVIPNQLAKATGSAVLTVKPGALNCTIKTIVVPVTDDLPVHKMETIAALCKQNRINIHLVTFSNEEDSPASFSASALLKWYQWLKESLHCPVEYAVLNGGNKARAIMKYGEKMNADVLLVDPYSETKLGWMNKHISDVLPASSKVQVLAVHKTI
jgi:nucleotide-binding universal stress UspA family protein